MTRDGTAEPVSRDQILRHVRGQWNIRFPCSADHEQDWRPYPVDPYCDICDDHTYIELKEMNLSLWLASQRWAWLRAESSRQMLHGRWSQRDFPEGGAWFFESCGFVCLRSLLKQIELTLEIRCVSVNVLWRPRAWQDHKAICQAQASKRRNVRHRQG